MCVRSVLLHGRSGLSPMPAPSQINLITVHEVLYTEVEYPDHIYWLDPAAPGRDGHSRHLEGRTSLYREPTIRKAAALYRHDLVVAAVCANGAVGEIRPPFSAPAQLHGPRSTAPRPVLLVIHVASQLMILVHVRD
jgi:hypothetical protein